MLINISNQNKLVKPFLKYFILEHGEAQGVGVSREWMLIKIEAGK